MLHIHHNYAPELLAKSYRNRVCMKENGHKAKMLFFDVFLLEIDFTKTK